MMIALSPFKTGRVSARKRFIQVPPKLRKSMFQRLTAVGNPCASSSPPFYS
jgi:hypothetical protein